MGKRVENMLAEYVWNSMEEQEDDRVAEARRLRRSRSTLSLRSDRLSLLDL